jgi:chromosome segregation ATPase
MDNIRSELKLVLDMTTRVDERIKLIVERQQEMNNRLNSFMATLNDLGSKVHVLESINFNELSNKQDALYERIVILETGGFNSFKELTQMVNAELKSIKLELLKLTTEETELTHRVESIEDRNESWWGKIRKITDMGLHGIWVLIVCYLLMKLGLQTSPIP